MRAMPKLFRRGSFASLRESFHKRVRARQATSNPTSPLSTSPRRPASAVVTSSADSVDAKLTNRNSAPGQTVSAHQASNGRHSQRPQAPPLQDNRLKRASDVSVYDNIANVSSKLVDGVPETETKSECRPANAVTHRPPPYPNNIHRPIAEREIPYNVYHEKPSRQYCSRTLPASPSGHVSNERALVTGNGTARGVRCSSTPLSSTGSDADKQYIAIPPTGPPRRGCSRTLNTQQQRHVRQIVQEPPVSRAHADYDNYPINAIADDDLSGIQLELRGSVHASQPVLSQSTPLGEVPTHAAEWPPDALTPPPPHTPDGVNAFNNGFDSSTLKRMLQTLPEVSPPSRGGSQTTFDYSNAATAQNSLHHINSSEQLHFLAAQPSTAAVGSRRAAGSGTHADSQSISHHSTSRDSYRDSGISSMTNDTTSSIKSGSSERSARSSTLPSGMSLSGSRHTAGSSLGGHSDLFKQFASSGSETTEVKPLTSSDLSGSESDMSSEDSTDSSIETAASQTPSALASKSAAVRKAGWLNVKNWLIHKKRKIELASKRSWKKYWVCLKGTLLLFYLCDENEAVNEDSVPRHMIVIEGSITQAVPEHPKRELIFSLSTAFGDAYLFQASSQIELENWMSGIHSACASSYARQHGKDNTLKLLRAEICKLENSIDLDIKMKKMAGLQLTVVADPRSKQAIEKQMAQWDENLEKLYIEQYRLRCYSCSLQGSELPNPKTVLAVVGKSTKAALSRLGVFTVTSLHAYVCARTPQTANALSSSQGCKRGLLSTFKADSMARTHPRSPSTVQTSHSRPESDTSDHVLIELSHTEENSDMSPTGGATSSGMERVAVPSGQTIAVQLQDKMTVADVLEYVCNRCRLSPAEHFLQLQLSCAVGMGPSHKVPDKTALISTEEYEAMQVCQKCIFQLELVKQEKDRDFGLQVEAELADESEQEDELRVFIGDITKGGVAHRKGLVCGDEILVINGKVVAQLDTVYVEGLLADSPRLCLTVRSCRLDRPANTTTTPLMEQADVYIENMVCPPPPVQARLSDTIIDQLIVPAPNWVQPHRTENSAQAKTSGDAVDASNQQIDKLLMGAEQVTHFCRLLHSPPEAAMSCDETPTQSKPLSDSQRIRKVIRELLETERQYVKDLNCLIERYLEPLKEETFLSGEDTEQLFGNIREIVPFQHQFLQSLEQAVMLSPKISILNEPSQFRDEDIRRILFSLAGSFLYYANHFRLYSSFCASHSKAQKVLNPDCNVELQDFLRARNPKQQHSATLESFLIKPIQRILKYPLLLRQLRDLTDPQTDEHRHLSEALHGMEAVAEHINEMQKIYEEYGGVFDELTRFYKQTRPHAKHIDLNVGDLQMYGNVNWLNALDQLGKVKKGIDLLTLIFVFKAGLVMLVQERVKGKKKQKSGSGRASIDGTDVARFQHVIPVNELQVRSSVSESERHGTWHLIHCRSQREGRPERVFHLGSSLEARREFLKTIHNTIRESVRRMSIPGPRASVCRQQTAPCLTDSSQTTVTSVEYARPTTTCSGAATVRHSMEIEEKVNVLERGGIDLKTRSRTLTDLNKVELLEGTSSDQCGGGYASGSQSTLASEGKSTPAARLLHTSQSPCNYSSQQTTTKHSGPTSPIWKPRHQRATGHVCDDGMTHTDC